MDVADDGKEKGGLPTVEKTMALVQSAIASSRATPPQLKFGAAGELVLTYDASLKTQLQAYGVWFSDPVVKATDSGRQSLHIACRVPHCEKGTDFQIANSEKPVLNFGNAYKHLCNMHLNLVRPEDAAKLTAPKQAGAKRGAAALASPMLDDEEELGAQTRLFVTEGLALRKTEGPGWRQYLRAHGFPSMSRRTLGRRIEKLEQTDVIEPRNELLSQYLRDRSISIGGGLVATFRAKLTFGSDGWTDGAGRQLESLTVCFGSIAVPGGLALAGVVPELRPRALDLSLTHWKLDAVPSFDEDDPLKSIGLKWDAVAHAREFVRTLDLIEYAPGKHLSPENALIMRTDTTLGQPAFVEKLERTGGIANLEADKAKGAPPMTGSFFGPCAEHVDDLVTEDMKEVALFEAVHSRCNDLSVWARRSDKRTSVLLEAQKPVPVGKRAVRTVSFPPTRFHYAIDQMHRMGDCMPGMQKAYENNMFGNDDTAAAFGELYRNMAVYRTEMAAIVELFRLQTENMALLGSTAKYTTSIEQVYYFELVAGAEAFAKTVSGMKITAVVDAYLCSLLARHASVSTINKAIAAKKLPRGSKFNEPEFVEKWKRSKGFYRAVYRDDAGNAAAFLDPAVRNGKWWLLCGHSTSDAATFIVRLLKGCVVLEPAGGNSSDNDDDEDEGLSKHEKTKLRKEYKKAVKEIQDAVKPDYRIDDAEFEREKAAKLKQKADEFRAKGLVIADADGGGGGGGAASIAVAAPLTLAFLEQAIQGAVATEIATYDQRRSGKDFGHPLAAGKDNKLRYSFWADPANLRDMPLLSLAAEILLGGMLAAMENERFHSAAAYIMNKLRRSLSVASLNRLTLCKIYLIKALDAENELRAARSTLDFIDVYDAALDDDDE